MSAAASPAPSSPFDALDDTVLLTLLYSDGFDQPLRDDELHRYLSHAATREECARAVARLIARGQIARTDGFVHLADRAAIVAIRLKRAADAAARWRDAHLRVAPRLAGVPFLRMAAVCGSQAVDNGDAAADIDLFLITAPRRLWIAQVLAMRLRRRMARRDGLDICPNHLMSLERLSLDGRDLFTAREAAQAVPLWGAESYERFLDANAWIDALLPQALGRAADAPQRRFLRAAADDELAAIRRRARRWERRFAGRRGDRLDALLHRLLLRYYPLRLGRPRSDIAAAYTRHRQGVVRGGYGSAISARFARRARALLGARAEPQLARLFPRGSGRLFTPEAVPDPRYGALLAVRYAGDDTAASSISA